MKIQTLIEMKKINSEMIDKVFDSYDKLSPSNFHTTFVEYFDSYFTEEQIDSGKMDQVIEKAWERFQNKRAK